MTCSHASFLVSQLNQLTAFDDQALKLVNKGIDRALRYGAVGMRINKMSLTTLYIVSHSDASLDNNVDSSSQISGLVVFQNLLENVAPCQYWSRIFQRVTPSTLTGEEISLINVIDFIGARVAPCRLQNPRLARPFVQVY